MAVEAQATPFTDALASISAMVQADATGGSTPPPNIQAAPAPVPADPAPAAATPETPTPTAPTVSDGKLFMGQYKSEDEAIKARHLLIHSLNAAQARADKAEADLLAARKVAPLSPGRADPTETRQPDPSDEKWREVYSIDPADVDARVTRVVNQALEKQNAPIVAKQAADAYILGAYPDFPMKAKEVEIFVSNNDVLKERVGQLWNQGLFAEAMEIGYLAYDNALRTVQAAEAVNTNTQTQVDASRGDATMLTSQAQGTRDAVPNPDAYPRTPEDWKRIREMMAAGRDTEVNRILYGGIIKDIPALNPQG